MIKPESKCHVRALDYHECEKYIAEKLGVNDLRDFAGKFKSNPDAEYQDWWHLVIEQTDVTRGSVIFISSDYWNLAKVPEWAMPIYHAFVREFGHEAEYWADW